MGLPTFQKTDRAAARLKALPVPDVPAGRLQACFWYMTFHGVAHFEYIRARRIQTFLRSSMGLDETTVREIQTVHKGFKRLRQKLPFVVLKKHPHYLVWLRAFQGAVLRRLGQFEKWDKVPVEMGERDPVTGHSFRWQRPYRIKFASMAVRVPVRALERWQADLADEFSEVTTDAPLLLLPARKQKAADKARLAEIQDELDASMRALHAPKVEKHRAGERKSAADIDLTPRKKRLFSATATAVAGVNRVVLTPSYRPHAGQVDFHNSGARFRTIVAGRRGGKTRGGAEEMVRHALMIPGSSIWVVSPTWGMSKIPQRAVLQDTILGERRDLVASWKEREKQLTLINGTRIEFHSAEWEDTLRGDGLDFVWIDEVQMVKEAAYKICEAATADTLGRIVCTGTPLGRNWLYRLWSRGKEGDNPDYASWRFTSTLNPLVPREELERARRNNPAAWFRQEYLAEFVEGMTSVFGNLDLVVCDALEDKAADRGVVVGLDLARKKDYTAIVVVTSKGEVVYTDRFNQDRWALQKERVLEVVHGRDGCPVVADASGAGDPFTEDLDALGVHVVPMTMSSANVKRNLIEQLMLDIEAGRLTIPRSEERLLYELQIYRRELTARGNPSYNAPEGEYDDMVDALALANWGVHRLHLASDMSEVAIVSRDDELAKGPRAVGARQGIFGRASSAVWARPGAGVSVWGRVETPKPQPTLAQRAAVAAVYAGKMVECTAEQWPEVLEALQGFADECIDIHRDDLRSVIALQEAERLNNKFRRRKVA